MRRIRALALITVAASACAPASGPAPEPAPEPAAASPGPGPAVRPGQRAEGQRGMVSAAHPAAAEAGLAMLQAGGNAVDAAVAAAFAVGVVEPMMSGLGGGGSMTIWLDRPGRAEHIEFYAAAGAEPDYGLEEEADTVEGVAVYTDPLPRDSAGDPLPERGAVVPGTVAGLLDALDRWGTLDRETVMAPAIRLAGDGFVVHSLLARVVEGQRDKLARSGAAEVFLPGGDPIQPGDRLRQPALAASLDAVARGGADAFYRGGLAERIVDALRKGGSTLTVDDFARYTPNLRRPVCAGYRTFTVLSAPPPLGGAELLEALNLLESATDPTALAAPTGSPETLSLMVDAIRVARADRAAWVGDPDDTGVPGAGLASDAFASERRRLLAGPVPDTLRPGDPWEEERSAADPACEGLDPYAATSLPRPAPDTVTDGEPGEAETTHLSVVDGQGNAVSLTYTMGLYFGSGAYAEGMFLNSAGYNFGRAPAANRRAPYRTPRSTTAPTIVLEDGRVRLVVGSPGSGRIAPAILHTMVYTLDLGYDPAEAVAMPRVYPLTTEPRVLLEPGFSAAALADLRRRGYHLDPHPPLDMYFGGVHAVYVTDDGRLIGVADPRREGAARGF